MKKHNKYLNRGLKVLFFCLCFFALKSSSCRYDDTELRDNIVNLENRVTKLEELKVTVNNDIQSLQTIVNSIESQNFVSKVEAVKDSEGKEIGYKITFQDGKSITIKHGINGLDGKDGANGKDGKDGQDGSDGIDGLTPLIGVAKDEDGVYYWTVDGEFLLGNDGEKLPVTGPKGDKGEDGLNAVAPMVRINQTTNIWEISIDNGDTWIEMKDANGDFISSIGGQGDKGEQGDKGAKGDEGERGETGVKGDRGAVGATGARGDALFKSIDYTSNPDIVYFTLSAKDNNGANIVLALPRVGGMSIWFADGSQPRGMVVGDQLVVKFNGLTEANYNSLVAELLLESGYVATDIVTRANEWIQITEPVFNVGKCDSTFIKLTFPAEARSVGAKVRVTLIDENGKLYVASRVVRIFASKLASAAFNGGSYTLSEEDVSQGDQIIIPEGKEFTLDLNGITVENTSTTSIWRPDEEQWSLFSVRGKMTIKDGSADGSGQIKPYLEDCYAIDVCNGGHLIIEGGTFAGNRTSVYVHKGTAEIKGGKFSVQQQHPVDAYGYVIDCYNANYNNQSAKALISGGIFVGFNPANCPAEGAGTSFVINGFQSEQDGVDGNGTPLYKVTAI